MSDKLETSSSGPKEVVRLVLAGIAVLCVVGAIGGWFFSGDAERKKLHALPDCDGDVSSACLELRAGTFDGTARRKTKLRSHAFETEDGERDRLRMKLSRYDVRELESGEVTGIYHDGDLIGIEDQDGVRRWGSAGWLAPLWFVGVALVLLAVAVGCGFVIHRMNQAEARDNPEAAAARKRRAEERLAKLQQRRGD